MKEWHQKINEVDRRVKSIKRKKYDKFKDIQKTKSLEEFK
jgi:hypothetical protein